MGNSWTHGQSETGFFPKYFATVLRFSKKPGFFGHSAQSETGFLCKILGYSP